MELKPTSSEITEAVLLRIDREQIAPRPRWHFVLREGVVWSCGALSVGIGAVAVAATLFEIRFAWWDMYLATHESFLEFSLDALPFVWLVCIVLFASVTYASIRYTKKGYRYPVYILLVGSVVLSGVSGAVLYGVGLGEFFDEEVGYFVPMHRSLMDRERVRWLKLDQGRLAGIVREVPISEGSLWLEGPDGVPYEININDFSQPDRTLLRTGEHVRVIGVPATDTQALHGCIIMMKRDDILRHIHMVHGRIDVDNIAGSERNVLFARSTLCKGVRPYARLAPQTSH